MHRCCHFQLRKLISHFKAHGEEAVRSLDDDVLMLYCINIMGEWVAPEWTAWLKTLHKLEDPAVAKLVDAVAHRCALKYVLRLASDAPTHDTSRNRNSFPG